MSSILSFSETALVFRNYSFKKLRHLLVYTSFKDFWYIWKYADRSVITFLWSIAFFINRCNIGQFHGTRKLPISKPLLSSLCITSVKILELVLIMFLGRSDSWQALELSRFKISRFISDFVISLNENRLSMFWLLIAIITRNI